MGDIRLDGLNDGQMQIFFVSFVARTIHFRLLNDVGKGLVKLPRSVAAIAQVERDIFALIKAGVTIAVGRLPNAGLSVTSEQLEAVVQTVYGNAFNTLIQLCEAK